MFIEEASLRHIEAMAAIYNEAVVNTTAVWTELTLDARGMALWFKRRKREGCPVLVATDNGSEVLGYSSFCGWRSLDGYRHTVESSVYVHRGHRGTGIGTFLLTGLIERANTLGKHTMTAGVDTANLGSLALHKKLGFREIGVLAEVGTKCGRWRDLVLLQLTLGANNPS
jgi:L-amino acid N-acyltransferase